MYLYSFASAYTHTLRNFLFISAIAQFWLCYSIVCNRLLSTHKHTWSIRYLNQCVSLECVRACVSHSFCIFRKFGFLLANLRLHVITIAYYIYIYFDLFILCSFYSFVRSLVDVALHSFLFHLPLCIHNTQTYKIYMHVSYICYHREKKEYFRLAWALNARINIRNAASANVCVWIVVIPKMIVLTRYIIAGRTVFLVCTITLLLNNETNQKQQKRIIAHQNMSVKCVACSAFIHNARVCMWMRVSVWAHGITQTHKLMLNFYFISFYSGIRSAFLVCLILALCLSCSFFSFTF